jgi:hypothetical protein
VTEVAPARDARGVARGGLRFDARRGAPKHGE